LRTMVLCTLMLVLTRLGSLNALEQCRRRSFWRPFKLRGRLAKADQLGRFAAQLPPRAVRRQIATVYRTLKRRKALSPASHDNLYALVLDGHECSTSYRRCCDKCLSRRINKDTPKERTQYYHRLVMAVLVCQRFTLLLDVEPQGKGEGEVLTAQRLLERMLREYPRAFDIVVADGLYAQAPFFKKVRGANKHVIAVLKNEKRDLVGDMRALCERTPARAIDERTLKRQVWDIEQLGSWPQLQMPVRVVRSVETACIKRQLGAAEQKTSEWLWVSTIPHSMLPTLPFIKTAHARWHIENQAFNELVNHWHADHVYKHDANAILYFWLMTMLAYNLFHAFYLLNVKPSLRKSVRKYRMADAITAEMQLASLPTCCHDP
jgi:hypothetical protein